MPVHCRVTPSRKFAGTHLYTWVERGTVRVKSLAQEHNAVPQPRLKSGPLDPESSTLGHHTSHCLEYSCEFIATLRQIKLMCCWCRLLLSAKRILTVLLLRRSQVKYWDIHFKYGSHVFVIEWCTAETTKKFLMAQCPNSL